MNLILWNHCWSITSVLEGRVGFWFTVLLLAFAGCMYMCSSYSTYSTLSNGSGKATNWEDRTLKLPGHLLIHDLHLLFALTWQTYCCTVVIGKTGPDGTQQNIVVQMIKSCSMWKNKYQKKKKRWHSGIFFPSVNQPINESNINKSSNTWSVIKILSFSFKPDSDVEKEKTCNEVFLILLQSLFYQTIKKYFTRRFQKWISPSIMGFHSLTLYFIDFKPSSNLNDFCNGPIWNLTPNSNFILLRKEKSNWLLDQLSKSEVE